MKPTGEFGQIALVYNNAWSVWNFRRALIARLLGCGFGITVFARKDESSAKLEASGVRNINWPIALRGRNLCREMLTFLALAWFLVTEKPAVVLSYTIKPNIYGAVLCAILGRKIICNVTGLGQTFGENPTGGRLGRIYGEALRLSSFVFFQNSDDKNLISAMWWGWKPSSKVLPGSGVDVETFKYCPGFSEVRTFAFVGRLIVEKGIGTYLEAAAVVKQARPRTRFLVCGTHEPDDPRAFALAKLDHAVAAGVVEYLGKTDDIREVLAECDCVVLPSWYREGVPRVLLEAAAMGKVLVAADAPGTREPVVEGRNGYLHRAQDSEDLVRVLKTVVDLSPAEILTMAESSRLIAVSRYSESIVLDAYSELLSRSLATEVKAI